MYNYLERYLNQYVLDGCMNTCSGSYTVDQPKLNADYYSDWTKYDDLTKPSNCTVTSGTTLVCNFNCLTSNVDNTSSNSGSNSNTIIAGYGISCQQNYSNCTTANTQNLTEAIASGNINTSSSLVSSSAINSAIEERYSITNVNNLCINNTIKEIIPVFALAPIGAAAPQNELTLPNTDKAKFVYARACTSGYNAEKTVSPRKRSDNLWGCCKPGDVFVVPASASSDFQQAALDGGYCCPTNGTVPGDADYPLYGDFNTRNCYSDDKGTVISGLTGYGYTEDSNVAGLSLGIGSSTVSINQNDKGSLQKCDDNSTCAIVNGANGVQLTKLIL